MSKKGKQAAAAPVAEAVHTALGNTDNRSILLRGLELSFQSAALQEQADAARESLSGCIMQVAANCGTAGNFDAAMVDFGGYLKSTDGVNWQKSHGIALKLSKDGESVILPQSFKNYARTGRRYLELKAVTDMRRGKGEKQADGTEYPEIPALAGTDGEILPESSARKLVENYLPILAHAKVQASDASDTIKAARLEAMETRQHVGSILSNIGKGVKALNGERLRNVVPVLQSALDAVSALVAEQEAEATRAKEEAEALKAQKLAANERAKAGLPVAEIDTSADEILGVNEAAEA